MVAPKRTNPAGRVYQVVKFETGVHPWSSESTGGYADLCDPDDPDGAVVGRVPIDGPTFDALHEAVLGGRVPGLRVRVDPAELPGTG